MDAKKIGDSLYLLMCDLIQCQTVETQRFHLKSIIQLFYGNIETDIYGIFFYDSCKNFICRIVFDNTTSLADAELILMAFGLLDGYTQLSINQRRLAYAEVLREAGETCWSNNTIKKNMPNIEKSIIQEMCTNILEKVKEKKHISPFYPSQNPFEPPKQTVFSGTKLSSGYKKRIDREKNEVQKSNEVKEYPKQEKIDSPTLCCHLPPSNNWFTGRENEMNTINEYLHTDASIVIVYGLFGIGKTQLVRQYVEMHSSEYEAIFWIDAGNINSIVDQYKEFLWETDSFPAVDSKNVILHEFKKMLKKSPSWLLVYDNCSYQQKDNFNNLMVLLPSDLDNGRILITARSYRQINNSVGFSLSFFPEDSEDAIDFLVKRSGDPDREAAKELASFLDYYPLALEIAAGYINKAPYFTLREYRKKIEFDAALIEKTNHGITAYDKSISQVIESCIGQINQDRNHDVIATCVKGFLMLYAFCAPLRINLKCFRIPDHAYIERILNGIEKPLKENDELHLLHLTNLLVENNSFSELIRLPADYGIAILDENDHMFIPRIQQMLLKCMLSDKVRYFPARFACNLLEIHRFFVISQELRDIPKEDQVNLLSHLSFTHSGIVGALNNLPLEEGKRLCPEMWVAQMKRFSYDLLFHISQKRYGTASEKKEWLTIIAEKAAYLDRVIEGYICIHGETEHPEEIFILAYYIEALCFAIIEEICFRQYREGINIYNTLLDRIIFVAEKRGIDSILRFYSDVMEWGWNYGLHFDFDITIDLSKTMIALCMAGDYYDDSVNQLIVKLERILDKCPCEGKLDQPFREDIIATTQAYHKHNPLLVPQSVLKSFINIVTTFQDNGT